MIEAEHRIQLGLLRAFRETLERGEAQRAESGVLLRQLLEYSEAHFLSEQLLMRQYAYPGYEQHVLEHDRLLGQLQALCAEWEQATAGTGAALHAVEDWLLEHLATEDTQLEAYLAGSGPRPS